MTNTAADCTGQELNLRPLGSWAITACIPLLYLAELPASRVISPRHPIRMRVGVGGRALLRHLASRQSVLSMRLAIARAPIRHSRNGSSVLGSACLLPTPHQHKDFIMPNVAALLQQRLPQTGMLASPQLGTVPPQFGAIPPPIGTIQPQFGMPRQQLTPQQLDMLMKMLGNSQPTPFAPIQTNGIRG